MKTTITLAPSAGYCFGVQRAVDMVRGLLAAGRQVCTLGPLIHNPQAVAALEAEGVRVVSAPEDARAGEVLVIRSHGVGAAGYDALAGREVCDATCPFVAKIHGIVRAFDRVLIAGDEAHPEVRGIRGHCPGQVWVFGGAEELENILKNSPELAGKTVAIVAQTTFALETWQKCVEIAERGCTNARIFDTICNATAKRQREALALAREHEIMVIVGGRQSSNAVKLRDVCAAVCPTVFVETAGELRAEMLAGAARIGVTAGASTPPTIIKEVLGTMEELVGGVMENVEETAAPEVMPETVAQATPEATPETAPEAAVEVAPEVSEAVAAENAAPEAGPAAADAVAQEPEAAVPAEPEVPKKPFDEMTFEEQLEESLQTMNSDEKVTGIVVGIAPNEVQVEVIGRKQAGYIPLDELSANPTEKPEDIVQIGDRLELLIMKTNDQEGTIQLSKKRIDARRGWDVVIAAQKEDAVLQGVVTDVIKGGLLVATNGVKVFVPASQASAQRMEDLSPLKGQEVRLRIIDEVDLKRKRAVGSIRAAAREERRAREEKFWEDAAVGQEFTGRVKSLTSFGAFVDIGGVDGLVHVTELSWKRLHNPAEAVAAGDELWVKIKALDPEKRKISLTAKRAEEDPWAKLAAEYVVGSVVTGPVVGLTGFGAFVSILPGVDGLVHISQLADRRVESPREVVKVGQEVTALITGIDFEGKRVSLSIRALLEPQEAEFEAEAEVEVEAEEVEVEAVEVEAEAEVEAEVAEEASAEE